MGESLDTVVLIDGRNLGGEFSRWRGYDLSKIPNLVIEKVMHILEQSARLIRVYYYYSIASELPERIPDEYKRIWTDEKKREWDFVNRISAFPFWEIRLGKRVPRRDKDSGEYYLAEKGVDMQLGVDLIRFARRFPLIVLISGDTDLKYAIHIAKEECRSDLWIAVAIPGKQCSQELIGIADLSVRITGKDIEMIGGAKIDRK